MEIFEYNKAQEEKYLEVLKEYESNRQKIIDENNKLKLEYEKKLEEYINKKEEIIKLNDAEKKKI